MAVVTRASSHKSLTQMWLVMALFIGCAGWSIRKDAVEFFPPAGTHLQRYAFVSTA